ncbi:uncharacterized protein LOC117120740 [Anneissia japonica]|uniref:uncharacterized protein LOC117120740 n=1 Tax=Anneissia japonica TaxID=1529436 RepID=UPI001425536C|nr:uncharacterized protein LOC117120740 [Anneissia japonica]
MDIRALRPQFNKKRKPNWSENEISFLLREFEKHKVILTSKLCGETTSQQKRQLWKLICDGLNARNPYVKRTTEEVRRKWKNLLSASKRELLESKRPYVEGGPPPRPISSISRRVIKLRGRPTVRSAQQSSYIHPAAAEVNGESQANSNYNHGLPTMVHVLNRSSNNHIDEPEELDELDDDLDDVDCDEFDDGYENEERLHNGNNTNSARYSPRKENLPTTITETKFTPNNKEHEIHMIERQDAEPADNLQIHEISNHTEVFASEVSPRIHNDNEHTRAVQNGGGSIDLSKSNDVSSRSSSPYSDIGPHNAPESAMLNFRHTMPDGYPIFTTGGLIHPAYAMYHPERIQAEEGLPHHPRSTETVHENGQTVAEIQTEMLSIQRDKLRLEKEVLELYKERMKMEVEWWRKRLQRSNLETNQFKTNSHTSLNSAANR